MNSKQRRAASRKNWSHLYSKCPKCANKSLIFGYGFAGGGGIGSYESCERPTCNYFHKSIDEAALSPVENTGVAKYGMSI